MYPESECSMVLCTVHSPTTIAQALVQIFFKPFNSFWCLQYGKIQREPGQTVDELQFKLSMNLNVPIPLLFNCIYLFDSYSMKHNVLPLRFIS